jgi:hypothetical protein
MSGVIGITGTVEDEYDLIKGNGKGITCTFFGASAKMAGKRVISNYKTSFSELMNIQNMIDYITKIIKYYADNDIPIEKSEVWQIVLLMDELDKFLNSLGSSSHVVNFVDRMVTQIRKIDGTIYHTEQRWGNLHRRARIQTEQILKPKKCHYAPPDGDGKFCLKSSCEESHAILVYSWYPHINEPLIILDAKTVGQWYNTREFIFDLPNVKEIKKIMTGENV